MLAAQERDREAIPRVVAMRGADRALRHLLDYGAVIIERTVSSSTIAAVERELAPWFELTPSGEGLFMGRKTRRFSGMFAKSPLSADLAIHPLALEIAERCLKGADGKSCDVI